MNEPKHFTIKYQLYTRDGKPNGIIYTAPVVAPSEEEAKKRFLKGYQSQHCEILGIKQDR